MPLPHHHQHKTEEKAFWGNNREGKKVTKFAETRKEKSLTPTILPKKIQKGLRKTLVFTYGKQISLAGVCLCAYTYLK